MVQAEKLLLWDIFQGKSIRTESLHAGQKCGKRGTAARRNPNRRNVISWANASVGTFVVQVDTPKRRIGKWCAKGRLSWHRIISRPFAGEKGFGAIGKCKYIEKGAAVGIPPLRLLFRCFLWRYHAYLLISASVIPGCSAMLMLLAMMFARRSTTASTSFGVTNRLPVYGPRISAII